MAQPLNRLRTHYDNLKVARDAPDFVIRAAYRTLSQKYHPDRHPGDERAARIMSTLNRSYAVLSDPEQRTDHDAWIAREEARMARQASEHVGGAQVPPHRQQPEPTQPDDSRPKDPGLIVRLLKGLLSTGWNAAKSFSPLLASIGLLFGGLLLAEKFSPKSSAPSGPKTYQVQAPRQQAPKDAATARTGKSPTMRGPEEYTRPAAAPNGTPWPTKAGYVSGYPIDNDDGHSKLTVDNDRNDADVFIKLVSLNGDTAYPVRQFFIPAHSRFTTNKVTAGRYDIRYRDLGSGRLSRSEAFNVEETRTDGSVQFSEITLTLYKVQDGNFQTYELSDSEF